MEVTEDDVKRFLDAFFIKMSVFKIVFLEREKNKQGLLDLEIDDRQRLDFLKKLKVMDYFRGPGQDKKFPQWKEFWEFGIMVNNIETYVKISMGNQSKPVICISFHKAEYKIKYKFK